MKWFGKILNGLRRVLCYSGDGHSVVDEDRTTRNSIDIGQTGPGMKQTIVGGYIVWRPHSDESRVLYFVLLQCSI